MPHIPQQSTSPIRDKHVLRLPRKKLQPTYKSYVNLGMTPGEIRQDIEDQKQFNRLTAQNEQLRDRLKMLSQEMDALIEKNVNAKRQFRPVRVSGLLNYQDVRQSLTHNDARDSSEHRLKIIRAHNDRLEKATRYLLSLKKQYEKLKARIDQLNVNPTYQT